MKKHKQIRASYGGCSDVTDWYHVYGDYYRCTCCGVTKRIGDLIVTPHCGDETCTDDHG